MKKYIIAILVITTLLLLNSCRNKNAPVEHGEEHPDKHENALTTGLTAEQIKTIGIQFGKLEKKQLTASLKANGLLKVPNQNRASATATYGGVVKTILVQPGNKVSKGQVLATISNATFISLQEDFLSTSAKTDLAQMEYERQKILKEGNAASQKSFQQVEAELKTLKAKKSSLNKQLELIGINTVKLSSENMQSVVSITSPINGSVSDVKVNIGTFVEANNPIVEIVDNSQLHLDLYVYEKDLNKLKVGQTIHFTLTNNAGKEYDAKIFGISNTFEPNTKAIAIHAQVEGDKANLIDGMSITALVSLQNAMLNAVPTDAIVSSEGQDYIFIVTDKHNEEEHHYDKEVEHKHDGNRHDHKEGEKEKPTESEMIFEKIPVKRGTTDVGYTEITLLKEIPSGADIVTKGAFFILAKMTNQGEAHEH
jgi:RND family efflux transporter MFP subunit